MHGWLDMFTSQLHQTVITHCLLWIMACSMEFINSQAFDQVKFTLLQCRALAPVRSKISTVLKKQ